MPFAIETRNLTKCFPKTRGFTELVLHPFRREKTTAIRDMNFQIKAGELFCLLGPNGAGKTTLLKILCGLIIPTHGAALISGMDSVTENQKIKREIGFVINEERSFYWRLTGKQNLRFFATLNNMSGMDSQKRIDELLELTNLKESANDTFRNYSSGMKQRLAIARALLTNPGIIIMDEPTRSLDPLSIATLKEFVIDCLKEKGKTLLIATHDVKFVEEINNGSIGIINKGRLLLKDSIANTMNGPYGKSSLDDVFSTVMYGEAHKQ